MKRELRGNKFRSDQRSAARFSIVIERWRWLTTLIHCRTGEGEWRIQDENSIRRTESPVRQNQDKYLNMY
jgi:hypothetical protein